MLQLPAYVNQGAYHRTTVSAAAGVVSGLTLPMPANLVVGNLLILRYGHRATANFLDDVLTPVHTGTWTLGKEIPIGSNGFRAGWYWKFVSSAAEVDVALKATAVGTAGSAVLNANILQFRNVHNPGTATFIEAVTDYQNVTVSGPVIPPTLGITTSGEKRLPVCLIATNNQFTAPSIAPTGETGGDWVMAGYGITALNTQLRCWVADMATAGTILGGFATDAPAAAHTYITMGFALAPCSINLIPQMLHHYVMMNGA